MIKDVFQIYSRYLYIIMFLSITIIIPITTLSFVSILYLYEIDELKSQTYIAGFLLLVNFILCAPPFLKIVLKDLQDESISWKEGILFFIKQLGPLFITTVILYLIALYTMWLFFIPSVLILMFLLIFPFFTDLESFKDMMKNAGSTLLDENIGIIVDLIIVFSSTFLVWGSTMYIMQNYENNLYGYLLIRVTLNVITLPFIYIYLAVRYRAEKNGELTVRAVGGSLR